MLLAALIQITIAMVHAGSRRTTLITMVIFATVAVSTLVIIAYDRPFGGGGVSVPSTALE